MNRPCAALVTIAVEDVCAVDIQGSVPESEQSEVDRLRAEVARLRGELEHVDEPTVRLPQEPAEPRGGWWRPVVVTVMLILVGLLGPLAVVATWADDQVGNTDRYVETVTPLAADPAVQRAIADRVTLEIFNRLDVKGVTQEAVDALESRGLPSRAAASLDALTTPLANGIRDYVRDQVLRLLKTDEFEQAWIEANRAAHDQLVTVLTGKQGEAVEVEGNAVNINLAAIIGAVKTRLQERGFDLVDRLPTVNAEFTVFQSADITKAQTAFRILGALATALPIVAVLLLIGAVLVSRSRRRTLVIGALVVAASMLLLGIGLNAFRIVYLDAIPSDQLPTDAAAAIYDRLVYFIRLNLRAVLVLFLAIAAVAWVTGKAPAPSAVRESATRALDAIRHRSDRAGLRTGGLGTALWPLRTPIRASVLGLALLAYVLAAHPTGGYTLVLIGIAALVLLAVELVARPPAGEVVATGNSHI